MSAHQFQPVGNRVAWRTLDVIARYWATRPGQTPELLRRAIGAIENWKQTVPPPTDLTKATYVWDERLLALDPDALSEQAENAYFNRNLQRYFFLYYLMPWEVYRARRALDYLTSEQLTHVQAVENAVRAGQPTARLLQQAVQLHHNSVRQTTPLLGMLTHGYWGGDARLWLEQQAQLNATLILLGLEGHRLEHGSLPVSLNELVGEYFQQLPRDPYSGDSFRYFPHGLPTREKITHNVASRWDWSIAAGVPFLWSSGPDLLPITSRGDIDDVFLGIGGTVGEPVALLKVLPVGWAVTIPQPDGTAPPVEVDELEQDAPADDVSSPQGRGGAAWVAPAPGESRPKESSAIVVAPDEPLR